MVLDAGDGVVGLLVGPDGELGFSSADGNAVVGAVAFVRAVGIVRGPDEQRHVCIGARDVVDGRVSLLIESECVRRVGDDLAGDCYTDLAFGGRDGDGMIRAWNLDLFALLQSYRHWVFLPSVASQSFEPPSTGMLAPVIQRAASETTKATTSATSSGLPSRFNACIASAVSRPVSVLVKFDMSVSMTPGAMALTRIPLGPSIAAQFFTRVSRAPLVEE